MPYRVKFPGCEATLTRGGEWDVIPDDPEDPNIVRFAAETLQVLDNEYGETWLSKDDEDTPYFPDIYRALVEEAAQDMGGEVLEIEDPPQLPKGAIP